MQFRQGFNVKLPVVPQLLKLYSDYSDTRPGRESSHDEDEDKDGSAWFWKYTTL